MENPTNNGRQHVRGNRGWIWYFVILFVLTVAAVTALIAFNLGQQLTAEKLSAAQAVWDRKGPRNYDLEYTKRINATETYTVQVRDGKVIAATLDGRPLEEQRIIRHCSIPGLFADIEDFLKIDAEPGRPRTFTVASFDLEDGHLLNYTRRVTGTTERVQITVRKLVPVSK